MTSGCFEQWSFACCKQVVNQSASMTLIRDAGVVILALVLCSSPYLRCIANRAESGLRGAIARSSSENRLRQTWWIKGRILVCRLRRSLHSYRSEAICHLESALKIAHCQWAWSRECSYLVDFPSSETNVLRISQVLRIIHRRAIHCCPHLDRQQTTIGNDRLSWHTSSALSIKKQ